MLRRVSTPKWSKLLEMARGHQSRTIQTTSPVAAATTAASPLSTPAVGASPAIGASSSSASEDQNSQANTVESSIHLREHLKVAVYWDIPPMLLKQGERPMKPFISDQPIAVGHISARFSDNVYAVTLDEISLSSVIEVGSRVFLSADALGMNPVMMGPPDSNGLVTTPNGTISVALTPTGAPAGVGVGVTTGGGVVPLPAAHPMTTTTVGSASNVNNRPKLELVAGLVARVNANGTFSILLDNDRFENAVPRGHIVISEGRSRFIHNESYAKVLHWVRNAGVDRRSDQESTATILYHRGWREDKLYLLESEDVHCLSHLNKSVRMCLLERAEWERDHHRQRRELSKERLKEREWRYVMTKYSGVMSACVAVLGVMSVFTWNFKNWQKQQRSFQLKQASEALRQRTRKPTNYRVRRNFEDDLRRVFRSLDLSHPRVLVCTGPLGGGKSSLIKAAAASEQITAIMVDIRGTEDPLKSLVKALGVVNVDACGDLVDFVAEASRNALNASGHAPVVVFKLRDEKHNLSNVYSEAISLACDRACCHVIVEINVESLRIADYNLPRCNFLSIPPFNLAESHSYLDRNIDPFDLAVFADVCGTNTTSLDELIASVVVSKREEAHTYTRRKMVKAMRHLQLLWAKDEAVKGCLTLIAQQDFTEGLRMRRVEIAPTYAALLNETKYAMGGSSSLTANVRGELKELIYYNPIKDAWMFKSKIYHSAASCWCPPLQRSVADDDYSELADAA